MNPEEFWVHPLFFRTGCFKPWRSECLYTEPDTASHLSLVLRLQPQPGLDAAPRLQEGLALSPVRQVADEDAGGVHAHEEHGLSCDLETQTHSGSDRRGTVGGVVRQRREGLQRRTAAAAGVWNRERRDAAGHF